ncbi:MAG: PilZ domain-containing protein [Pseudobdellovibrionaceae bacterium]
MGDVIDFRSRSKAKSASNQTTIENHEASVVDITEIRTEVVNQDRRQVRRTILTEFIAVHTVVPGMGLMKVALFNVNENGLAFDIDFRKGHFQVGEEVAMRVYLNHQTYFPFVVRVKHITDVQDEEVHRHGCEFVGGTINDVALHHFIKFIENVSASLKHDKGDILVSNINS